MTIEKRVKEVVSRQLRVKIEEIQNESNFVDDLGADSMASIELVAAFEAEFDIEMDEDAALAVKTVGDAVTFIDKVVDEQNG